MHKIATNSIKKKHFTKLDIILIHKTIDNILSNTKYRNNNVTNVVLAGIINKFLFNHFIYYRGIEIFYRN